jgi:hypothetical protein
MEFINSRMFHLILVALVAYYIGVKFPAPAQAVGLA